MLATSGDVNKVEIPASFWPNGQKPCLIRQVGGRSAPAGHCERVKAKGQPVRKRLNGAKAC